MNTNLQDFRHTCEFRGGRSKCHICEDILCLSENGTCALQLQGVRSSDMSTNIPAVSDVAWPVNGLHKTDYGGDSVSHYCVFLRGGDCIIPYSTNFTSCITRCFGHGFPKSVRPRTTEVPQRTIVDVYPGQNLYPEDGKVDYWAYPRNCSELNAAGGSCTYAGFRNQIPSFNPQGFTFTFSGSGESDFVDGPPGQAAFYGPEGIAVDKYGYLYVADTQNHAIRTVRPDGYVTTLAGGGHRRPPGYLDGNCSQATFSSPRGLSVRYVIRNGVEILQIVVADTGNHRIRRLEYVRATGHCFVSCLSGLCGNSTLSETKSHFKATPNSGYADGSGLTARFSAPAGVTYMDAGYIAVADTGNYLIRLVSDNGTTWTLAGTVGDGPTDSQGEPLAGCPPPCLVGVPGYRDGNLTHAQFKNPVGISHGPNNTLYVTDEHRIRIVELPDIKTHLFSATSEGRVATLAGQGLQGYEDGIGDIASFFDPSSVVITSDNFAYVVDSASCRVRRLEPLPNVALPVTCHTSSVSLVRPSGCTSFDQIYDLTGRKVSRVEGSLQFNYGWPYEKDVERGKYIKNCVGAPPPDTLQKHFVLQEGDNLVIDDGRVTVNEDSEQGMAILVKCPTQCRSGGGPAYGTGWYSEDSSVCTAAIHSGAMINNPDGYIQIVLERRDYVWGNKKLTGGSLQNGIQSLDMNYNISRVFSVEPFNSTLVIVQTIIGHSSARLEDGCGYADAQPAQAALLNKPRGIAAFGGLPISDSALLYIADTGNNRIRCASAVCSMICENQGRCVGADHCLCKSGWSGVDCTIPICETPCGLNRVCVAPNTCGCKPGYNGTHCDQPQCVQRCLNGARCIAPDTCGCVGGWFDANCSTPVCSQTCANGANCTAPNRCACPSEWKGQDCRIPVCKQECKNGGYCMAPNTCSCPPQWSSFDCSVPVCTQGFFKANPSLYPKYEYATPLLQWPLYKYCDIEIYCNATREFDCYQDEINYGVIAVPSGPLHRAQTGRKHPPNRCMPIELPTDYEIPFELLRSDNTTTGYWRYAPKTNYSSNPQNPWRGYLSPVNGHTGPWTYTPDRQVAYVQWLNVTQGVYLCANGGNCTAPNICECAPGWMGFDCRTPICTQGYYFRDQKKYVSGLETSAEVYNFRRFLGSNSYRLQWPYSNPNYTIQVERYVNESILVRFTKQQGGKRYFGPADWTNGSHRFTLQGGYRCSIRAWTKWENVDFVFDHPNFYSRYMDAGIQHDHKQYTNWTNMFWPATHSKSRILVSTFHNVTYIYTNEGFRLYGIWNRTANSWAYGTCIMEFSRNCSVLAKTMDLESSLQGVLVQDTDLSFRPRVTYTNRRVEGLGWWVADGGECVNEVVRGCYNNGTCIAPDKCKCAPGWSGYDCSIPVCDFPCLHHGNCTLPNTCTCERGWEGYDCAIPICAQECQNGGKCVAPDTCQCNQWPNEFVDGRVAQRPFYRKPNGDAQDTGWTGYDCSVPICVQGSFVFNVDSTSENYQVFVGRGGDNLLQCADESGIRLPRCPMYDYKVTSNDGKSFQTGCGHDPWDDGCCIVTDAVTNPSNPVYACYKCRDEDVVITENTFYCTAPPQVKVGHYSDRSNLDYFGEFVDYNYEFRMCGRNHTPYDFWTGQALYYKDKIAKYSNTDYRSNITSNRFLCNVQNWTQGDFIDSANLSAIEGVGTLYGLSIGRHIRTNDPHVLGTPGTEDWSYGLRLPGEGIYSCANRGSCIAPDKCTCQDGYDGYDCKTPLCRHLQPTGIVTGCMNGGICVSRDTCVCVQTESVLALAYPDASRGITGWTGSDCSMPMCVQGYFDPFCTNLPQALGGEGCYRCANGGNCTAPDVCQCAEGWSGFDCRTPVCEIVATPLIRLQLGTVSEAKIVSFESDPCGVVAIYGHHGFHGHKYTRGNCTQPNECTCLCFAKYDYYTCREKGTNCDGAWQDELVDNRDVLTQGTRKYGYIFGTTDCYDGYEGEVNELDRFTSCHMQIFVPNTTQRGSLDMIYSFSICGFFFCVLWYFVRRQLKRRYLMAKIERRRSRRSSEESLLADSGGAFGHS